MIPPVCFDWPELKLVTIRCREVGVLSFEETCSFLRQRFDFERAITEADWLRLDDAYQESGESLHEWADCLRFIGFPY